MTLPGRCRAGSERGTAAAPHRFPVGGLTSVLCVLLGILLPFMRLVYVFGWRVNFAWADLLLPLLLVVFWGHWHQSRQLGYWLLGLAVLHLLSWLANLQITEMRLLTQEVAKIATCYGFALVGYGIGRTKLSEAALAKGLLIGAAPIAAVGIYAYFTGTPPWFVPDGRVQGTFIDPNAFAIYMATIVPISTSLPNTILVLPLLVGATLVSLSRTGLAAAAGAVLFIGVVQRRLSFLVVVALCGGALALLWPYVSETRLTEYGQTMGEREDLWRLAYETALDHPLLGVGKSNFMAAAESASIPHNTYLTIAAENGFIGIALFFVPLGLWVVRGLLYRRSQPWAIAMLVMLVAGLSIGLDNWRLFWLSIGIVYGCLPARAGGQSINRASREYTGREVPPEQRQARRVHPSGEQGDGSCW